MNININTDTKEITLIEEDKTNIGELIKELKRLLGKKQYKEYSIISHTNYTINNPVEYINPYYDSGYKLTFYTTN